MASTITDIAQQAGVSISTVSRVLNYDESLAVADTTRRRIFETAEQLNYTKYKKKRQAKKRAANKPPRQNNIAFFQWLTEAEELGDVYYLSMRMGVEKRAAQRGYNLIRATANDDAVLNDVQGSLAIGKFDEKTVQEILNVSPNTVFVGTTFPTVDADTINGDFEQAAELALNHLFSLGHKKIALISAQEQLNMYGYRTYKTPLINAYRDIMRYYGYFDERYFAVDTDSNLTVPVGRALTERKLKDWGEDLPTAILAGNDLMAVGVINALQTHGIRVPEDVSVVGINDLMMAQYLDPPLTTVKIFTEEMGETGLDTLISRIKSPGIARRIVLSGKLITRGSTAKPR